MYGGTIARITVRAGNPGQVVITGDRFAAHETVAVTIGSTTVTKEADADGGFVLTFDVPGGGVGVVVAEGQSSKRRATAQFTLPQTSPTPSAPASSASVGPPSIGPSVPPSQPVSAPPSVPPTALSCFDPVIRQRLIVFYSNFPSGNYHLKCVDPATR